jgi:hypothetical protein
MKLTKNSVDLLKHFDSNNCIVSQPMNSNTISIFTKLYHQLVAADQHNPYTATLMKIVNIPKPKTFTDESFPPPIINHINKHSKYYIKYEILLDRRITIFFILEKKGDVKKFNRYVNNIVIWLKMVSHYASHKCSKELTLFFYFTSLKKELPLSNNILSQMHINTGFTYSCQTNSEIVLYREEEWFKVFIHESFHNFGLDFSDMNNEECHRKILTLFPVNTKINLFEAYTEFWAKIINALICSHNHSRGLNQFLEYTDGLINGERIFCFFQTAKILKFMDMDYVDLYTKNTTSAMQRRKYKEDTNVMAYYILTLIMLSDYQSFLKWCNVHNTNLMQFKKTKMSQIEFANYIIKNHQTPVLLDGIECSDQLLEKTSNKYLLNNLQMAICEMG